MKKLFLLLVTVSMLLSSNISVANNDNMKKGWEAFMANDREKAINYFKDAANDADTKDDANLALAMAYRAMSKREEGFKAMMNFYKSSPNPYPYFYALWSSSSLFDGYGKKSKEELALLNSILLDKRANSLIKAQVHSMIGYHYSAIGDFKKANAEFALLGSINNWQVTGTFDNISASGFNKDFKVLENPKSDAQFENKVGAKVSWFEIKDIRTDRWFDFNYHFAFSNSIMYAQSFVNSPADQEVILKAGMSGSMKIWVNDFLVISEQEERNADLDVFSYKVKLNKGYNRILVQIGESEVDRANFMVRFTDLNDNVLTNLTASASYQPYTKATEYKLESTNLFAEDFFNEKLKKNPESFIDLLLLAETYVKNDKMYDARKAYTKAKALAPTCSYVSIRLLEVYDRDGNNTEYTTEQEKIKKNDPKSLYALNLTYNEAKKKEDYNKAEEILDEIIRLYGSNMSTDLKKIDMIAQKKNQDVIIKAVNDLYKKYSDDYSVMALKYVLETQLSKDLAKANAILKKYMATNYSDDVITTLADNYFKLGNINEGIKLYQMRVTNRPYVIGNYGDMADIYEAKQDYATALKYRQESLNRALYHGYYYNQLGKLYEALNKTSDARDAYQKAIYYEPTNYSARKQLAILDGKKDLFDNFQSEDVYEIFKNSPSKTDFPDDNSIILLHDRQRIVFKEGANEEKTEILIKVFDQAGIDAWKEYSVGYNGYTQRLVVDKAEVLKANGNRIKSEYSSDYFVFTNLEPGDAIHLSYKIENYNSGKMALHFWDDFNFNYFIPCQLARYSLMVADNKTFTYNVTNSDMKPTTEDVDGFKKYTWELKNSPSFKSESVMPPLNQISTRLELSSIPDWQFIANWYSDLASTKAKSDFEVQETVQQLFKDKKNLSELEKARIIYDYIEKNMTYSNVSFMHSALVPQKASRVISTKMGDCKDFSTLFVAMAKEVGLKANLVLVNTRDNGERVMNQPTIDFNHCIVQTQLDGKTYMVELTDQKLSFGTIPSYSKNSTCLVIPKEGEQIKSELSTIKSVNRPLNASYRESTISFNTADMIVDRKTIKSGEYARQTRGSYADVGKDKQEEYMTKAISKDFTSPVKLNSLSFVTDLKTLADSVGYNYTFTAKSAVTDFSGIKLFKLPWADSQNYLEYLTHENRKFPFNLWELTSSEYETETITIEIPKGKTLAEQPKPVKLSCGAAEYNLTYKVTPTKVTITRTLKINNDEVSVKDYPQIKEFLNKVIEADSKQFGFKNAAGAAAQ